MEVHRIAEYKDPSYPDSSAASKDPALLMTMPERWKHNATVCAALAATAAMLLEGCDEVTTLPPGDDGGRTVPLFMHGVGMGGYGCVSVTQPVFLSEDVAFSVIDEIARQEGLTFTQDAQELKGVFVPKTNTNPSINKTILGFKKQDLLLDGYDEDKKIGFEFVSKPDVEEWSVPSENTISSGPFYSTVDAAKALSESLGRQDNGMTVGVFYDPNYKYTSKETDFSKMQAEASQKMAEFREQAKEDLRAQVRDFIAWLKAQGII